MHDGIFRDPLSTNRDKLQKPNLLYTSYAATKYHIEFQALKMLLSLLKCKYNFLRQKIIFHLYTYQKITTKWTYSTIT